MADMERKVTQKTSAGINESGEAVKESVSRVETKESSKTTTVNAIWYIYGFIAILLGLRLLFKLFGANSGSAFVDFIYSVSGVFSAPFDNIFGVTVAEAGQTTSVFEPVILVAIAIYGLIAWGIVRLLNLNES